MRETFSVRYTKCGFCTARNHCAGCSKELSAALAEKAGVYGAVVNLPEKTLEIDCRMDRGKLEDVLDGMGLMID